MRLTFIKRLSVGFLFFTIQIFQHAHATLDVSVSIVPQKYLLERIGGDYINVKVIVGADSSPETYQLSAKQMTSIQQSRLYFLIGLPFEDTIVKKIALSKPAPEIIECCRKQSAKAHHHGTHIWTSPVKVKEMAEIMKRILIRNLPDHRITLENNYRWLIADLDRLDQYIRSRLQKLNDCYIIVYHPAWDYYAEEYGLTQIAIESDGKETSAKSLTRIIDLAVSKNIRTIFVQRQFSRGYAEIIARQLKADIIELNPLAEDYINNLYHVTDAIVASKQPL